MANRCSRLVCKVGKPIYRGAEAWNGLSSDLQSAKSIFIFKTKINCLLHSKFSSVQPTPKSLPPWGHQLSVNLPKK